MGKAQRDKERRTLEWLPDYDISENGEVRRVTPARTRGTVPYVVSGSINNGYVRAKLVLPSGVKKSVPVHRLVCEAFHGPAPSKAHVVAHWDGVRNNNNYKNLRWATVKENNSDDRIRHGKTPAGIKNPKAKMTPEKVAEIRRQYTGKYGDIARLARAFGMSHSGMDSICKWRYWRGA
jgi:hypothetical protein